MSHMPTLDADLLVIGWGKGGKTLARTQALAGRRVVLVEADENMVGGTCINVGCVPTKALVHRAAERRSDDPAPYFEGALRFRDALTTKLRLANRAALEGLEGVTLLFGWASFVEPHLVKVTMGGDEVLVRAEQVVINTGSTPVIPPIPGLAESSRVIDSTGAQELDELPARLIVLGGGPIGLEMADMFARFGSAVTLVERAERLVPREDEDVAASVQSALADAGVDCMLGASLTAVADDADGIVAELTVNGEPRTLRADRLLVVVGRTPAIDGLNLDAAGIETGARGEIVVDEYLRTTAPGVWAIGDVNGGPQFTYISYDDYRIVAPQLAGGLRRSTLDRTAIPTTLFLTPPLARVGLSETQARAQVLEVVVKAKRVADIAAMPRPKALEETHGLIKLVIDAATDQILGAALHTIDAQEVINLVALAMRAGVTAAELRDGVWTHPSTTEALNEVLA